MQIIYFLLVSLSGLAVHFLLNLQVYSRGIDQVDKPKHDVLWNYFNLNLFYSIASLIITIILSILLNLDGGNELISILTGGNVVIDKPFGFYLTAFLMGFMIDYVSMILRKLINPLKVTLNENQKINNE